MTLERAVSLSALAGSNDRVNAMIDLASSEFSRRVIARIRELRPEISEMSADQGGSLAGWCYVPVGREGTQAALDTIVRLRSDVAQHPRTAAIVEHPELAGAALEAGADAVLTADVLDRDDAALDFAEPPSEPGLRLVYNAISKARPDHIAAIQIDATGAIHLATDGMRRLLGFPRTVHLEESPSTELFLDESVHDEITARLASGGDVHELRTELRHFNGRAVPVVLDAARHAQQDGHWVVVATDDTERRRLEAELIASEAHHRFLTSATPVGLIEADFTPIALWFERLRAAGVDSFADHADDHPAFVRAALRLVEVRSANPAAARLLGDDGFELVDVLTHAPENVDPLIDALDRLWQGKHRSSATLTIRRDGRRDIQCTVEITIPRINRNVDYSRVLITITDETKQIVTERSLITAVRNFRTTFEQAPTAMFKVDPDGTILEANETAAQLHERAVDELVGVPFDSIIDNDDRMAVAGLLMRRDRSGEAGPLAVTITPHSGERRMLRLYAAAVEDAYGRSDHLIVQATDATDEIRADQQRAAAERRFANIFRSAPGGLLLLDLDGRVMDANDQAEQMLGARPTSASGREWVRHLASADRSRVLRLWRRVLCDEGSHQLEGLRLLNGAGSRLLTVSFRRTSDGDGTTPYVICQLIDETPIIEARLDAQLSDDRFRTLFEHSPIPMFEQDFSLVETELDRLRASGILDLRAWLEDNPAMITGIFADMRILDANQAAVRLLEAQQKADIVGHMPMTTVSIDTTESAVEQLVAIWERRPSLKTPVHGMSMLGRPIEGELHCLFRPTGAENDSRVIVAIVDMREQQQLQRQLERAADAADSFLSALSHRLRTPLTAVIGFAEEVEQGWTALSDEERAELAKLAATEGTQLARTIEDLLVVTRLDLDNMALRAQHIDVLQLLVEVARDLDIAATWTTHDHATLPAFGDPDRIKQILRHLLDNARRHGGPNIEIAADRSIDRIEVSILDDGFGIPVGDRIRVFLAGVATSGAAGNPAPLGFGLAVATRLANAMGGELSYHYEGGRSRFTLTLPASSEPAP